MNSAGAWLAAIVIGGVAVIADNGGTASDPTLTQIAGPRDAPTWTVFVVATRNKPQVIEALKAAGITVSTDLLDADFLLRVTVGAGQGAQSCGTRHNVKYSLKREDVTVLELVEKGYTGTCTPNVLDALSERLGAALASGVASQDTPLEP